MFCPKCGNKIEDGAAFCPVPGGAGRHLVYHGFQGSRGLQGAAGGLPQHAPHRRLQHEEGL